MQRKKKEKTTYHELDDPTVAAVVPKLLVGGAVQVDDPEGHGVHVLAVFPEAA